jgi:hypothetical protein
MFDFRIPGKAKLRKCEMARTHRYCKRCSINLSILNRSPYCLECSVIAKQESKARARANKIAKALK